LSAQNSYYFIINTIALMICERGRSGGIGRRASYSNRVGVQVSPMNYDHSKNVHFYTISCNY